MTKAVSRSLKHVKLENMRIGFNELVRAANDDREALEKICVRVHALIVTVYCELPPDDAHKAILGEAMDLLTGLVE